MSPKGAGTTASSSSDEDVALVCHLRTLNGAFDRTNFSLIQPEHTASLTLRCEDLLFESTLTDGSFRHLGRSLKALVLDRCKIGPVPAATFAGLERLRNLTIRTRNSDWGGAGHTLRLHEAALRSVPRLRRLDLSDNGAKRFPTKLLCGLGELKFVNLSENALENAAGLPFGYGLHPQHSSGALRGIGGQSLLPPPSVATGDMSLDSKDSSRSCPLEIEQVELARNRLRVLMDRGFSSLHRLRTLDLRLNLIARAEEHALVGLQSLQLIDLSGNQLVALPPSFFRPCASKLTEIRMSNNSISVLPPGLFSGLDKLVVLDASRNELTSHWLAGGELFNDLLSLAVLDLSYNRLSRIDSSTMRALSSLQVLQLHHNEIETIADGAFSTLASLHALAIGHNRLKRLTGHAFDGPGMLGMLQLDNNALEEIADETFEQCCMEHLMELNLSTNRLKKVPKALEALKGLRSLDLGENEIEELPMPPSRPSASVSDLSAASEEDGIDHGPLQGLQQLYSLRLQGNFLGNLSKGLFQDMPSLRILNLARNRIVSVEQGTFDDVPELHALRLDTNQISDINGLFGNLHDLLMLNVSANRVSWFDYALVPVGLQWLDLHDNRVEGLGNYYELDGSLVKLRTLDASKNKISELDSSSLPDGIEIVFLGDNRIENIAPFAFVGKQNLTRVDLSRNKISTLDMNSLRLSEVPSRRPLPEFSLAGNPFLCDCHLEWLQRLTSGALNDARLYPRLVDADKLECRLTFPRGGSGGFFTLFPVAKGEGVTKTDSSLLYDDEENGVSSISVANARPSQFLCRYKTHCFALCHCCEFDACDCEMVCPDNCSCFYDQSWNANVVDCSSRNHTEVPTRVPMDVTELYLDGNDIPNLSSHTLIGRKNLRVLHLNGSGVQSIRNRTFNGLRALEVLQLARNRLVVLQGHEFERLVNLRELYLSRNRLTSVANGTFNSLRSLRLLRLDHNYLVRFQLWQLDTNLATLRHLRAAHNPWSCRCSFARRLADWLKARDQHGPPGMVADARSFQCRYNVTTSMSLFLDPRNTTPAGSTALLPHCFAGAGEGGTYPDEPLDHPPAEVGGGVYLMGPMVNSSSDVAGSDWETELSSSSSSTTTFVEKLHSPELIPVLIVLATVVATILFLLALLVTYRRQVSVWAFAKYGVRLGSSPALKASGGIVGGGADVADDEKLFDAFVSYSKKDESFVSQILAPELECGDPPYRLCLHYRDLPVGAPNHNPSLCGLGRQTFSSQQTLASSMGLGASSGVVCPSNALCTTNSGAVSEALSEALESSRRTVIVLSENFLRGEWCDYEFKSAHLEAVAQQRASSGAGGPCSGREAASGGIGSKKHRRKSLGSVGNAKDRLLLVIIILGKVPRSEVDADLKAWLKRHPVLRWGERHFWEKLRYALPDVRNRRRRGHHSHLHSGQQQPPQIPIPPVPTSHYHPSVLDNSSVLQHHYQTLTPPKATNNPNNTLRGAGGSRQQQYGQYQPQEHYHQANPSLPSPSSIGRQPYYHHHHPHQSHKGVGQQPLPPPNMYGQHTDEDTTQQWHPSGAHKAGDRRQDVAVHM